MKTSKYNKMKFGPTLSGILSRVLFLLLTLQLISHSSTAQFGILSQDAKVSLVTVAPGNELYSGFGHSVLWVTDPIQGIDRAYNYGTFSFETGNFYIKFGV